MHFLVAKVLPHVRIPCLGSISHPPSATNIAPKFLFRKCGIKDVTIIEIYYSEFAIKYDFTTAMVLIREWRLCNSGTTVSLVLITKGVLHQVRALQ